MYTKHLSIAAAAVLAANLVMAQIGGSGSIQGTVSDPSGAVIPGATVAATNVATGVKTTRQTTGAGVYVVSPLPAGEYTVAASADGFQTLVQERVMVDALSMVGLNLTLKVGATAEQAISVEAVDQFQVETSGAAVMFNGQGSSNYVLKSGSNKFHGSAFEYFRNTVLDARGLFSARRPKQNQNEFGFTIGGPIQKNRISPISNSFQAELPAPTNANLQNNYLGSVPVGFNNTNTNNKVDLNLTDSHRVSVVFNHGKRAQNGPYRGGSNPQVSVPLPYTETRLVEEIPTSAQAKYTYVITPGLLTQLSVGFSRLWIPIFNATIAGKYPQKAGLKGLPPGEADSSFPEVTFGGPNAPITWRGTDARAFTEALNTYTVQDNVQWVRGKHAVTIGFQTQRLQANERERTYGSLAIFNFSNLQTAGFDARGTLLATTGSSYASYLLGTLNSANITDDFVVGTGGRFRNYAWWVQDDLKLTPRLTLNLGLRHDVMEPYKEVADRWSFLNPDLPNAAAGGRLGALQFAGFGEASCKCRTPIKTHHRNLGPRVGLAYSLSIKTV